MNGKKPSDFAGEVDGSSEPSPRSQIRPVSRPQPRELASKTNGRKKRESS